MTPGRASGGMRLLGSLAALLLLAGLATANEPYTQSAVYVAGYDCCTFGVNEGDARARFTLTDALAPAGAAPGVHVAFHGSNHNPLQPALRFCGASDGVALAAGLDHMHVYALGTPEHLVLCQAGAGPGATVGTAEVHFNEP